MQNDNPDWQVERSGSTDVRSEDVRLEFRENKAAVTEQIRNIRSVLVQHDARMTTIEKELRATEHIAANQKQLEHHDARMTRHDARMTRIENEIKSIIRWWIGVTGTISGAIIGAAKFLSG